MVQMLITLNKEWLYILESMETTKLTSILDVGESLVLFFNVLSMHEDKETQFVLGLQSFLHQRFVFEVFLSHISYTMLLSASSSASLSSLVSLLESAKRSIHISPTVFCRSVTIIVCRELKAIGNLMNNYIIEAPSDMSDLKEHCSERMNLGLNILYALHCASDSGSAILSEADKQAVTGHSVLTLFELFRLLICIDSIEAEDFSDRVENDGRSHLSTLFVLKFINFLVLYYLFVFVYLNIILIPLPNICHTQISTRRTMMTMIFWVFP